MSNPREVVFRPFMDTPEPVHASAMLRRLRHPLFAWARLRPIIAQHTSAEHKALKGCARGRRCVVEIGVAEGASAVASTEVMSSDGTLYLIDPFHLSRVRWLNCQRRAARVAVSDCQTTNVVWIEQFSFDAVKTWNKPIDFLFIDGDHSEQGVTRDWNEWSQFVIPGGIVAFHDSRMFEGGWPKETDGPVRAVDRLFRNRPSSEWSIVDEVHSLVIVERR
jgi:predicted O-methyltransferase YrrM